jgi:hypothetical protein
MGDAAGIGGGAGIAERAGGIGVGAVVGVVGFVAMVGLLADLVPTVSWIHEFSF